MVFVSSTILQNSELCIWFYFHACCLSSPLFGTMSKVACVLSYFLSHDVGVRGGRVRTKHEITRIEENSVGGLYTVHDGNSPYHNVSLFRYVRPTVCARLSSCLV